MNATIPLPSITPAGTPKRGNYNSSRVPVAIGRTGSYRFGPRVGRGGTSEVFAGQYVGPLNFRMPVAIKVAKAGFEEMLVHEARLMSGIRHPNIVSILALERHSDHTFYVMERVQGVSLKQLIRSGRSVPLHVCLNLAIQLCDALSCLHQTKTTQGGKAIVHGDIKPTNIMVTPSGQIKLIDFGIATPFGQHVSANSYGTPAYMAPEQILRNPLDARTDLFSFGAVLFELLTGKRLFSETNIAKLVQERLCVDRTIDLFHITTQVGPRCPELCELIHRCVREKPVERFASFEPVGAALRVLRDSLPKTIPVRTWWEQDQGYAA